MKGRSKTNYKKAKKQFSRTADRTHKFNLQTRTQMRGGIRM
jgi:hypothetical protein